MTLEKNFLPKPQKKRQLAHISVKKNFLMNIFKISTKIHYTD